MAIATYDTVLELAQQLTLEEQQRLREELATESSLVRSLRALGPLDTVVADEMERAIQEGCERIDEGES
jgi:hypothetical protein